VKIVQEYERGVIFRLGRLVGARGPGLFFLMPFAERMQKMDLRIVSHEVPAQEAITRDNVSVKVNAVGYFRVIDPEQAVVKAVDYLHATSVVAQTTLRSILGQSDLDHLLSQRDQINESLQVVIDGQTAAWGVKVTQTLTEIAAEKNSTRAFPLPLELLQGFLRLPAPATAGHNGSVPKASIPTA